MKTKNRIFGSGVVVFACAMFLAGARLVRVEGARALV